MLQSMRNNIQGTMAKVIVTIICVPFVAFGIDAFFGAGGGVNPAVVNGEEITALELSEAIYLYKRRLSVEMAENLDPAALEDGVLKGPVLNALIEEKLLSQAAKEAGFSIAKTQVDKQIVVQPEFQQDGKFSADFYENRLRSVGLTPLMYIKQQYNQLLIGQLLSGFSYSAYVSDHQLDSAVRVLNQKRDIDYFVLSIAEARSGIEVTDEELLASYEKNATSYMTQEQVAVEYLELKMSDFYPEISEEQLREEFERRNTEAEQSIRRQAAHILIEPSEQTEAQVVEQLNELRARAIAGESFADLAKQYSQDLGSSMTGGDLGFTDGSAFPAEFEAALSELEVGSISQPVTTESGLHLIKLLAVESSTSAEYEDQRETILAEMQRLEAESVYATQLELLADSSFNASDLEAPAQELELTVNYSGFFGRDGANSGLFSNAAVIGAAFGQEVLNDEVNSEVMEIASDHAIVLRLKEHRPAEQMPLDRVRSTVEAQLIDSKARSQLQERAQGILNEGADLLALAEANGASLQQHAAVMRSSPGTLNASIVQAAFSEYPGTDGTATGIADLPDGSVTIYQVSNVVDGDVASLDATMAETLKMVISRAQRQQEQMAYVDMLRQEAKIELN
ncbi:MAG: SurA N-terminal domain-containing protein [Pseudomonadales bacterium]